MAKKTSVSGSELFVVDTSDEDWKAVRSLHDWCQLSRAIDIATGYFKIRALLALGEEWKNVDKIRILMGGEVSKRTQKAFVEALAKVTRRIDEGVAEPFDVLADDAQWRSRPAVWPVLAASGVGLGRELFALMRVRAGTAEQGVCSLFAADREPDCAA